MDIDLVYLWCDGSQPKMLEKRLKAERELGIDRDESVNGKCRYVSTDELRFSLRSVELYAPWIRRIFIIVDDEQELPEWLKTEGTKVTIVRHSEIMTPDMLPTFNSTALTFRIPFIEGLAEHFLFANDDMMLARDVAPAHFFTEKGDPIVYHAEERQKSDNITQYHCHLINCEDVVVNAFGISGELAQAIGHWPHHNIQGIRKSHLLACNRIFAEQIAATCHSKFRTKDNLQEWLMSVYALAIGQGQARLARDLRGQFGPAFADSLTLTDWSRFEELLYTYKPLMFCVNDNQAITDQDRVAMKTRLSRFFDRSPRLEADQNDKVKVSVIIPVYNAEKYLRECLDSVLNQSLNEIEVICIDDGSTDGSSAILQEYAAKDSRIIVLAQANQGPGVARNVGLAAAKGEYITFLDADDFFMGKRNLSVAFDYAMDNRLDVLVLASNKGSDENGNWTDSGFLRRNLVPPEKVFAPESSGVNLFLFMVSVPWAKLFRRQFIATHGLEFPPLKRSEDFPFMMATLVKSETIGVLDIPLCNHRMGIETSLESTKDETSCVFIEAANWFCKFVDLPHQPEWVKQAFRISQVIRYAYNLKSIHGYRAFKRIVACLLQEADSFFALDDACQDAVYSNSCDLVNRIRKAQDDEYALVDLFGELQVERSAGDAISWASERDAVRSLLEKVRAVRDTALRERDVARRTLEKVRAVRDAALRERAWLQKNLAATRLVRDQALKMRDRNGKLAEAFKQERDELARMVLLVKERLTVIYKG